MLSLVRRPVEGEVLTRLGLLAIVVLSVVMFLFSVQKPVPPGVDASVYINEARWSLKNRSIPHASQPIDHGSRAYTAPLTSLNISILYQLTGADLSSFLISAYQIVLIILLALSSFLVGRTFSPTMSLLFPICVLGNFAISRLFIGSTISNILTFIYINLIYYSLAQFFLTRRMRPLLLIPFCLIATYYTHNYLTAPILFPVFALYIGFLYLVRPEVRLIVKSTLVRIPHWGRTLLALSVGLLVLGLALAYIPVFKEAKFTFWQTKMADRFIGPVPLDQFGAAMGPALAVFGGFGLLLYVFKIRDNLLSYRVFPVLWLFVLFGLLQLNRIGISFFFERIVFLGAVFLSLFAAYLFESSFLRNRFHPRLYSCLIALFIILVVTQGAIRVKTLYLASNRVSLDHIAALEWLRYYTGPDAVVFSTVNAVSQTAHDVIVTDRTILHFTTVKDRCAGDPACVAFTTPNEPSSVAYFRAHGIANFLFLRPGEEGDELMGRLLILYKNSGYKLALANRDALIYQLPANLPLQ